MFPCPTCGSHLRRREPGCPHCGASLPGGVRQATAAALLLGLVACTGGTTTKETDTDTGTVPQAEYGATVTDTVTTTPQPEYGASFTDTAEPHSAAPGHSSGAGHSGHSGHSGAR